MQAKNEIRMRILEDGTISCSTDDFEGEIHQQAEELINEVFEELGGERRIVEKKPHKHQHSHVHTGQKVKA